MSITCLTCHTPNIKEVVHDNKRFFYCDECQKLYERACNTTYGKDVAIPTNKGLTHLIAGGLIRYNAQFLLLKRRAYPFGYAFPAGHVEYQEEPVETLKREVLEETGLKLKDYHKIFEGEIKTSKCRYGADNHYWYFYECTYDKKELPVLNSESEGIGWFTKDEAVSLPLIPSAYYLITQVIVG